MSLNPSLTQRSLWNPRWHQDVSEPLTDPKMSLKPLLTQRYLWTPHWPKDVFEALADTKMSLNPSLTQRCLWTPHWPKDVSEPLTDPKMSLNPSLTQRCLWTPHWPKDVSEPLTDPKMYLLEPSLALAVWVIYPRNVFQKDELFPIDSHSISGQRRHLTLYGVISPLFCLVSPPSVVPCCGMSSLCSRTPATYGV